jgi:hypothetical protein
VHRRLDIEHEQGHCDGEDRVGERLDPVFAHATGFAFRFAVHRANAPPNITDAISTPVADAA